MSLIEVVNLKKNYVNDEVVTHVLHDVNFKIEEGEFVAIMGPSGSGKSTLMHILSFLDRPTSGLYKFENKDIKGFDDDYLAQLRNEKVGFVFQSFNLLARTTVLDNVRLPLIYSKTKDYDALAEKALAAVGMSHRLNYFTNQISGGEKQRVAIARALVNNPAVIFADEPTGNLDSANSETINKIIVDLRDKFKKTFVIVTHNIELVKLADEVFEMKDGNCIKK